MGACNGTSKVECAVLRGQELKSYMQATGIPAALQAEGQAHPHTCQKPFGFAEGPVALVTIPGSMQRLMDIR